MVGSGADAARRLVISARLNLFTVHRSTHSEPTTEIEAWGGVEPSRSHRSTAARRPLGPRHSELRSRCPGRFRTGRPRWQPNRKDALTGTAQSSSFVGTTPAAPTRDLPCERKSSGTAVPAIIVLLGTKLLVRDRTRCGSNSSHPVATTRSLPGPLGGLHVRKNTRGPGATSDLSTLTRPMRRRPAADDGVCPTAHGRARSSRSGPGGPLYGDGPSRCWSETAPAHRQSGDAAVSYIMLVLVVVVLVVFA